MNRLFLFGLCVAGLVTVGALMIRVTPEPVAELTKIDDEVSITRLPDDVIVVVGPNDALHVSRLREPKPLSPATKGAPTALRWTLPYSCADVRYYERTFTKVQLEAMRKAFGVRMPTPAERQQISACLQGKVT